MSATRNPGRTLFKTKQDQKGAIFDLGASPHLDFHEDFADGA